MSAMWFDVLYFAIVESIDDTGIPPSQVSR